MSQGFTQNLPIPLPVNKGGTGVVTSTGTGNVVLSTSPTLATPALGTPSSGDLQNCTSATTTVKGVSSFAAADFVVTAGAVTSSSVSFRAYKSAGAGSQALTTGTFTKITLDTEDYDSGAYFASSRHTPLVAGTYIYMGSLLFNSVADTKLIITSVFKNGAEAARFNSLGVSGVGGYNLGGAYTLQMNGTTDYVELYGYHEHGSNRNVDTGSAYCWFSGIRIGP